MRILVCLMLLGVLACEGPGINAPVSHTLENLRWEGPSNWTVTQRTRLPKAPVTHHVSLQGPPHAHVWIQRFEGRVRPDAWHQAWSRARGGEVQELDAMTASILGAPRTGRLFEYSAHNGQEHTVWREVVFHLTLDTHDIILAMRAPQAHWEQASQGFALVWGSLSIAP